MHIDPSNLNTHTDKLYYTRNHQSARWNMRKSIMQVVGLNGEAIEILPICSEIQNVTTRMRRGEPHETHKAIYPWIINASTSPKAFGLTAVRSCLSTAWPMAQTYNNNHLRLTASRPCMQHREARGSYKHDSKEVQTHSRAPMPKRRMPHGPNIQQPP